MSNASHAPQLQPAVVLHHRPYRESSLLVELFTAEHGRIGLVAKGARGNRKSSNSALLQPFQPLLLSWIQRGELGTITTVEARDRALLLSGAALFSGFYLNELLMRLLARHDPHPELFERYEVTLQALTRPELAEWALRLFERDLLQSLGYGLLLEQRADGEFIEPQMRYCYHLERGPQPCLGSGQGLVVMGETLLALASGELPSSPGRIEAKRLMRAALALYLGNKPLQSRELFRQSVTAGLFQTDSEETGE